MNKNIFWNLFEFGIAPIGIAFAIWHYFGMEVFLFIYITYIYLDINYLARWTSKQDRK